MQDDGEDRPEHEGPAEVELPWQRLTPAVLEAVLEEYVTREGTDYGDAPVPLATKVAEVRRQLERGQVVLLYDASTQSLNVVSAEALRQAARAARPPADE